MSLAAGVNNAAIDNLVRSSLESENEDLRLEWIPYEEIANMKPTQSDNIYNAIRKRRLDTSVYEDKIMLLLLGSDETCTPTLVSEFARTYSLPTHKYKNDVSQYRRYSTWLESRNKLIYGFTKYEDNY